MCVLGIQGLCIIVGSQILKITAGILESRRESWNLGIFTGISKSSKKSRNLQKNHGIFKRITESSKNHGIFERIMESSWESRNLIEYLKESWNQWEFCDDSESR